MDLARDSLENRLRRIESALADQLGETWWDVSLRHTFTDAVIIKVYDTNAFMRIPYEIEGDVVRFGAPEEVDEVYILSALVDAGIDEAAAKAEVAAMKSARKPLWLAAPIVAKNDEQRIVMGPVLVPDEPDSDGDVVSAAKIEEVAHKFLSDYRIMDSDHTLEAAGVPVESYITPVNLKFGEGPDAFEVPAGTWMLAARIDNDASWASVKSGEFTGFSIWGCRPENAGITAASVKASSGTVMVGGHAHDVVTLAELGDDWVVPAISLVPSPAVSKAKYVLIKSRQTLADKMRGALKALVRENARATIAGDDGSALKGETEEGTMDEDKVQELVTASVKTAVDEIQTGLGETIAEAVKEAVTPLTDRMGALEDAAKGSEGDDGDDDDGADAVKTEIDGLKSEITELKEGIESVVKRLTKGSSQAIKEDGSDDQPAHEPGMKNRDGYGRPLGRG